MNLNGATGRSIRSCRRSPIALGARDAIDPAIDVSFPTDAPPLAGRPSLARFRDLATYIYRFDLAPQL